MTAVLTFAVGSIGRLSTTYTADGVSMFALPASTVAFWSAASTDATRIDGGSSASDIARSQLWPQGQPDQVQSMWQELKGVLLAENQGWQVWTNWYDDRLEGRVHSEARELTYLQIDQEIWDQGPAAVNAEIVRRSGESEAANSNLRIGDTVEATVVVYTPPQAGTAPSAVTLNPNDIATSGVSVGQPELGPPQNDPLHAEGGNFVFNFNEAELGVYTQPLPSPEEIPAQVSTATNFRINVEGLIDLVPDPPGAETVADPSQKELYKETRSKADLLVQLGHNQLGDLNASAQRFRQALPDRIEDLSIITAWSRGNTLRTALSAHDRAMTNVEFGYARLPPLVAAALRDLVETWNVFIFQDPKGRKLDEIRLGPQERADARELNSAASAVINSLRNFESVATEAAKQALIEQAEAAEDAREAEGVNGDQAIGLAARTNRNFIAEVLQRVRSVVAGEVGFASKEFRGGFYKAAGAAAFVGVAGVAVHLEPQFISFVVENANELTAFAEKAWRNPVLTHLIQVFVRGFS